MPWARDPGVRPGIRRPACPYDLVAMLAIDRAIVTAAHQADSAGTLQL